MKFLLTTFVLVAMSPAFAQQPPQLPPPLVGYIETGALHIDRVFPSMEGPSERVPLDPSQIDWITSFTTEVIDNATNRPMGDEFFCHSQLQLTNTTRLMVAATGSNEVRFPPGFAMPVTEILAGLAPAERRLTFLGMVLNNHEPEIDVNARVRATIEFYRKSDVGPHPPLKKIFKVGLPMTVEDLEAVPPPSSAAGEEEDVSTHCVLVEGFKGHWMVPPGRQITRKTFDAIVPVESTVHLIVTHLHNHGDYLRLTDRTTDEVLFQTDVVYETGRKQIAKIPTYSSVEGFKIHPDHTYEIEASYTNDTGGDVDAMAVMDLYYHPKGNVTITYPGAPD